MSSLSNLGPLDVEIEHLHLCVLRILDRVVVLAGSYGQQFPLRSSLGKPPLCVCRSSSFFVIVRAIVVRLVMHMSNKAKSVHLDDETDASVTAQQRMLAKLITNKKITAVSVEEQIDLKQMKQADAV